MHAGGGESWRGFDLKSGFGDAMVVVLADVINAA
jgi:hypothetical protein